MTYSLLALDPETGDLAVGVASCYPAVGATVPWARAGIGVVATQALTEPAYGRQVLETLHSGASPDGALAAALAADPKREFRQVGVIAADGTVAAHTGSRCIPYAAHVAGAGSLALGNLLRASGAVEAMAAAFEHGDGTFAERVLASLRAGEAHGGDLRGKQSAALLIVSPDGPDTALRVDDHPEPLGELSRLLEVHVAHRRLASGLDALFDGDFTAAADIIAPARSASTQIEFWFRMATGATTADLGPDWFELERRLRQYGHLRAPGGPGPSGVNG